MLIHVGRLLKLKGVNGNGVPFTHKNILILSLRLVLMNISFFPHFYQEYKVVGSLVQITIFDDDTSTGFLKRKGSSSRNYRR